jgi:DNA-binding MarR family transcriptional regulator
MAQELLDPISRLALHVFRAQQSLVSVGDDLTSQWGLTSAKWKVLGAVELSEGPPTASGIGRTMGMTRQAATKQIGLLVERGLLIPHDNPLDARASVYTLSQDGKATYDAISAAWAAQVEVIRASIDDVAITGALTALAQLVAEIEQVRATRSHLVSPVKHKESKK